MRAIELGGQRHLQLTARDHRLQIACRLLVIPDHGGGKGFLGCIASLLCELAGLDLEHVAYGGLLYEIFRRRADAERRINTGLFSDGLRHGGCAEKREDKARG